MDIDEKIVDYVAALSRIHLEGDDRSRLADQLGRILSYVEKLNELDTDGIEPLAHPMGTTDVFRRDEGTTSLAPAQVLTNAPDRKDDFFTVPAVIE